MGHTELVDWRVVYWQSHASIATERSSAWALLHSWLDFMAAPFRILAVDDEPVVAFSLRHVFAGPRYELLSVEDGLAALAKLDDPSEHYDAIIVDQKMPRLSGLELVGAIRERGIPGKIIVLSAQLTSELREAYKRMDVDAIVLKPFDIEELRSAVITKSSK
jgi:CheY-like chemotaxis protein